MSDLLKDVSGLPFSEWLARPPLTERQRTDPALSPTLAGCIGWAYPVHHPNPYVGRLDVVVDYFFLVKLLQSARHVVKHPYSIFSLAAKATALFAITPFAAGGIIGVDIFRV